MLFEARTKMNTTRYAHFSRLVGMTQNEHHPKIYTYTDRHFKHRYPPLVHQTIRTHTPFGHMVGRPVDHSAGQISTPLVKDELLIRHMKVSYPDSFFTDYNITKENLTIPNVKNLLLDELYNVTNASSNIKSSFPDEWSVLRAYHANRNGEPSLVNATSNLTTFSNTLYNATVLSYLKREELERWMKLW